MSPCWMGSSALTVLISVLLPEPEGPQTTTTSPFLMWVVQSVSTWKLPYHLETISITNYDFEEGADHGSQLRLPPRGVMRQSRG